MSSIAGECQTSTSTRFLKFDTLLTSSSSGTHTGKILYHSSVSECLFKNDFVIKMIPNYVKPCVVRAEIMREIEMWLKYT